MRAPIAKLKLVISFMKSRRAGGASKAHRFPVKSATWHTPTLAGPFFAFKAAQSKFETEFQPFLETKA
jgi:hypothetical protein